MSHVRLAAYASPLRTQTTPTGVGQHILGMLGALQRRPDVSFGLLTPSDCRDAARELTESYPDSRLLPLPWPDRWLRIGTTLSSLVNVDRWLPDADWVYTPVEQPVTTRKHLAVTVHDLLPFEPSVPGLSVGRTDSLSWRVRMSRIFKRADLIATVSQFTRSRMIELFDIEREDRIVVVGNGGAEGFSSEPGHADRETVQRYGLAGCPFVLFPASLTRRKGADLLLRVARLSEQRKGTFQFVVIGKRHDGELLSELQAIVAGRPSFPIRLLGYVTNADLAALYRHAHAALFPSRYEGFGIPVIEALASGCPLLITRQPALLEVAGGRATVIDDDPSSVLEALEAIGARPREDLVGHTWSDCAARLVAAMR